MRLGTGFGLRLAICALTCVAMISVATEPAAAGTIDWQFNFSLDSGLSASGTLVTQDTPGGGPFLVTSIQNGLLDGNAMTLLAPSGVFNDNRLSLTNPLLDDKGLGFTAEGFQWAIWSQNGLVVDSWCNNSNQHFDHFCSFPDNPDDPHGAALSFTVQLQAPQAVPEPGTLVLIAAGLLGLGLQRRRRGGRLPPL